MRWRPVLSAPMLPAVSVDRHRRALPPIAGFRGAEGWMPVESIQYTKLWKMQFAARRKAALVVNDTLALPVKFFFSRTYTSLDRSKLSKCRLELLDLAGKKRRHDS